MGEAESERVSNPSRVNAVVSAAAVVVILAGIHLAASLVIAVTVAFIVTAIAAPLQIRLIHAGWRRIPSFLVVLTGTIVVVAAFFLTVNLSLTAFVSDLPMYRPGGEQLLSDILRLPNVLHVDLTRFVQVGQLVRSTFSEADILTRAFLRSLAGWTVVLALTGFMLYEALDYPEKARRIFGSGSEYQRVVHFTRDLSRFMGILTVGAVLTAAGDLVVLLALGIPSALLWAAIAFLLSYIPNVGAVIIVIPPTIATIVRFGFGRALLVLVLMLAVDNIVGVVIIPRLVGKRLLLAPFWGMLSIVFWGWLIGPAGAILAVPLTMLSKFLLEGSESTRRFGTAMAPLVPVLHSSAGVVEETRATPPTAKPAARGTARHR